MTGEAGRSEHVAVDWVGRKTRRTLTYAALGLGFLMVLLVGLRPEAAPVEIAPVTLGPMEVTLREEGKTRLIHRYVISSPLAARLRRISLKVGDEVRAGETVLVELDPLPAALLDPRARAVAEARLEAARAEVERARATLDWAARERTRVETLLAQGSATPQERDAAVWRHMDAVQQMAVAGNRLRMAQAELETFLAPTASVTNPPAHVTLLSPINGHVLRVFEESERVIAPGTPLLELGNLDELEVVIEVLSHEAVQLRPGQPVRLEQWGGSVPLEARIRRIEPAAFTKVSALGVEEQRVRVVADLITPPQQRVGLGDQFRVEAVIVLWQAEQVRKVPLGALFRRGSAWAVFVWKNGRAHLHRVELGAMNDREAEVRQGLEHGETVILYPGERVRHGQRVRPVQIAP